MFLRENFVCVGENGTIGKQIPIKVLPMVSFKIKSGQAEIIIALFLIRLNVHVVTVSSTQSYSFMSN